MMFFLQFFRCINVINIFTLFLLGISALKCAALIRSTFAPWFVAVPSAVVSIDAKLYVMPVTAIVATEFLSTNLGATVEPR
jgi:hypothetical protein